MITLDQFMELNFSQEEIAEIKGKAKQKIAEINQKQYINAQKKFDTIMDSPCTPFQHNISKHREFRIPGTPSLTLN